jgi:hypothetical protein
MRSALVRYSCVPMLWVSPRTGASRQMIRMSKWSIIEFVAGGPGTCNFNCSLVRDLHHCRGRGRLIVDQMRLLPITCARRLESERRKPLTITLVSIY